jgi:hypothetical protein
LIFPRAAGEPKTKIANAIAARFSWFEIENEEDGFVNNTKRQAPSCAEVVGGLLLLLVISAICRGITAVVTRHQMEQIYQYHQPSQSPNGFHFDTPK